MAIPTQAEILERLQAFARSLGGDIREVSEAEREDLLTGPAQIEQAPFTMWDIGIDWKAKVVYFGPHEARTRR